MLHDITIRNQAIYTKLAFWRLGPDTHFAMHCQECRQDWRRQTPQIVVTERITHMNYQPRGISDQALQGPASYLSELSAAEALLKSQPTWNGVTAEAVARMRLQNRFRTGLDIARYTASVMRADMEAYDNDPTKYTQSLGCWHGFIAQQKLISIKKHFGGKTDRRYLYLSGWMIAALRSEFGPLPDQSMHEKTSVPALIEELYTFLRQADARELNLLFQGVDAARKAGDKAKEATLLEQVDNFQTHVVPIIADID